MKKEGSSMLLRGLQEINNCRLSLLTPANLSPDPHLLEKRYEEFRAAS
jgi:hypothetical protein